MLRTAALLGVVAFGLASPVAAGTVPPLVDADWGEGECRA